MYVLVQISICCGIFSEKICQANPQLSLTSIDPWLKRDDLYEISKKRLAPYNCAVIRDYRENAYKQFADNSLDFVYIDGNHEFRYVAEDIYEWEKKVRKAN
jgi:hypothetical protein